MSDHSNGYRQSPSSGRMMVSPSTSSIGGASAHSTVNNTGIISVSKTLAQLLALPANRSCADCRVTLVDSSQVYASYSPKKDNPRTPYNSLMQNHEKFAPPNYSASSEHFESDAMKNNSSRHLVNAIDPCSLLRERGLGHGVFVCAMCGAAHKLMAAGIAEVHAVKDPVAWNVDNVQQLVEAGNAHCSKTFEAFIPQHWKRRRPRGHTDIAERLIFIRAKYEALAFCLPPSGPLAPDAWKRIVDVHPEWKRMWGKNTDELYRYSDLELNSNQDTLSLHNQMFGSDSVGGGGGAHLPNRLVDFFCVVSAAGKLDPKFLRDNPNLKDKKSVEEFYLAPTVTDCYPKPDAYSEMEFPEHVGSFVYPEGCRPSSHVVSPNFFTFVLTCADGNRMYGGALKLHDKTIDLDGLKAILRDSGYEGGKPSWFDQNHSGPMSLNSANADSVHSDIAYLPKCLVILSHYPFFHLWRKFLLQIYRIALVEAPLPIERFISNFVSEVPLPPPGKIEVRFGFTAQEIWSIKRPPDNELPLADFSFQPLFASLSVSSVMVVMGCLLQETRVVLLSKHYALLTPVAEALLGLLFPLHWHGMYIPIMPYAMLDILDAPVPFLVGLHSRYLQDIPPSRRPVGVVFVDLDNDIIHLGWSDEIALGQAKEPRQTPALPEKDAMKLKTRLANSASSVYVTPDSGKAGSITYGDEKALPFGERDSYCHINSAEVPGRDMRRKEFFRDVDKAYDDNEASLSPEDFLSGQGLFHEKENGGSPEMKNKNRFGMRLLATQASDHGDSASNLASTTGETQSLLDVQEPKGFSVFGVRNAFLRFFVGIFKHYREYISEDGVFRVEQYLVSLNLATPRSEEYMMNLFSTQMFERFLQERFENPNDPEVMFFDVSIDAKQNRFRKAPLKMLRSGGKGKDTSFLDDKSKQVTEKFTPPPPSHWGLPDDGRSYHYGSFPELDSSLFGNVRAPKIWAEYQSTDTIRNARRPANDIIQKQQLLVNGLLGTSHAPLTSSSADSSKRKANHLELALFSLSKRFMRISNPQQPANEKSFSNSGLQTKQKQKSSANSISSSESSILSTLNIPPESSAETIVLNARRRTSIFIAIFVIVQAQSRGYLSRKGKLKGLIVESDVPEITTKIHTSSMEDLGIDSDEIEGHTRSIAVFQSIVRRVIEQNRFQRKVELTVTLQSWVRTFVKRRNFYKLKNGIILLQALGRGRLTSFVFRLLQHAISKIQARHRGHSMRAALRQIMRGRLEVYRRQIFVLWKRTHASLAYRTKMWTILKSEASFLRHNLAEFELERLWGEMHFIADPKLGVGDSITTLSEKIGLSNNTYAACLNFDKNLEMDHEEDFSQVSSIGSVSMSSKSISFTSSSDDGTKRNGAANVPFLLASERTQIYERLSQSSNLGNEQVIRLYDKFNIGVKDKKRKKSLAEAVWRNIDQVNDSVSLMYELFPELRVADTIRFIEPTRKGIRRFQFDFKPAEFEMTLRAQKLMDDRIRKNVSLVASLALCKTPTLLGRLAILDQRSIGSGKRRQASVVARGFQNWNECRLSLMKAIARNELIGAAKPCVGHYERMKNTSLDGSIEVTLGAFRESLTLQPEKEETSENDSFYDAVAEDLQDKLEGHGSGANPFDPKPNPFDPVPNPFD